MTLDDLLLKAKPLYLDTVIDNFGYLKNVPASIKNINGKFIICNAASARRDGISIEEYIGLTAYDIGRLAKRRKAVTKCAVEADKKLCAKEALFATYKQSILAHDRYIVIEEVCKRPVLGSKDQVAAILGSAQDITHCAHPMFLFKLYESFVPTQEAIQSFLRYKKLDTLFSEPLSREELLTLITMRDSTEAALIAKKLGYSFSEIKRYQAQLRDKLSVVGLDEVLTLLQWHDPNVTNDVIGGISNHDYLTKESSVF